MNGLTAAEAADRYGKFLEDKGFLVRRSPCGRELTAEGDGAAHRIVVVDSRACAVPECPAGTVVAFSGPVDRALVHGLTMSNVPVVWWNGTIWNGSGTSYAAGLTTM